MRCEEAESDIAEYLKGTLSPESAFPEHLAQCVRCRDEVEELRKVWTDLGRFTVPVTSTVMQAGLLAAMEEARLEPVHPITKRRKPVPYIIKPILVVLLSLGGAFVLTHRLAQPSLEPAVTSEQPAPNDDGVHYRGALNPKITLVEYGDYECPPCAVYNSVINTVLERYGNTVRLEFRHFPLMRHPNALKAALAAEAAGRQGRYWEMHDLLLSAQQQWAHVDNAEQEFTKLALSIGLDTNRFLEALGSTEMRERVMADVARGQQIKVQSVPTFFLNGRKIDQPPNTAEGFFGLIDAELKGAK